ncbi:MAG: hypothetical protein LBQ08_04140 [Holosporaceae bacterium]|nr:hypothetical protein [Holosporaceae bacterium]
MKVDFKNINSHHIKIGSVFYLYGNYKKTFEVFCDFVRDELQKKMMEVEVHFCSVTESLKIINGQCNLFGTKVDCFFIRHVEDSHLEKVSKFFNEKNSIFVLESGNYLKSKKITDYFLKSDAIAVSSFYNDQTLYSLCRMFFPNIPQTVCDEIVRIIKNTDEELYSVFKKAFILSGDCNCDDFKNYSIHKQSFLSGLNSIPLIRFLLQTTIRERIIKSANFFKINILNENAIYHLLNAELKQKFGVEMGRGYIYQRLI